MAQYSYLFMDLRTQAINAELPCEQVTMSQVLNSAGRWQGKVPLNDPGVQRMNPKDTTQVGRTAVLVDRDGTLIWGGILWTRKWDTVSGTLELGAGDFLTYFAHRYLSADRVYTNQDQAFIVRDLLNFAQGVTGGNIHINVPSVATGVLRSATWLGYELTEIARTIEDQAALEGGFDFGFDVQYAAGVPTITFNLGYPRRGRGLDQTGWMWEFPGNITSYTWPEDGEQIAETAWAVGGGSGTSMVTASSTNSLLAAGWPLLEIVKSYKDVTDSGVLAAHAQADALALANPVTLPVLTVRADQDPVLGSYITGDDARVRLADAYFNAGTDATGAYLPGFDGTLRIHQIDITPPSGDQAPEQVQLTMGATQT